MHRDGIRREFDEAAIAFFTFFQFFLDVFQSRKIPAADDDSRDRVSGVAIRGIGDIHETATGIFEFEPGVILRRFPRERTRQAGAGILFKGRAADKICDGTSEQVFLALIVRVEIRVIHDLITTIAIYQRNKIRDHCNHSLILT